MRQITLERIKPDIAASVAAKLIDKFGPKLEKLLLKSEDSLSTEIYKA